MEYTYQLLHKNINEHILFDVFNPYKNRRYKARDRKDDIEPGLHSHKSL